jgi:hypothetical protein
MKKIFLAILLAAAAPNFAAAQLKPFSIGPYAEAAFPTGNMADFSKTGFGGGLAVDVRLPLKLGVTGSAGFLHFGGQSAAPGVSYSDINVVPVRVGIKYRFSVLYAALETGAVIPTQSGGKTNALLAPAIGVRLLSFDIRGKYETWFQNGAAQFWGIQAAVKL